MVTSKFYCSRINATEDETIVSVIKRLFGEHISSRLIRMQNREVTFRCITYNLHRMLNLIIIKWILQSLILFIR